MQRLLASNDITRLGLLLLAGSAAASPLAVLEKDQLSTGSSCDAAPGSLLADLQARGAEASSFCNNYLCAKPLVAVHAKDTAGTVSVAAHPMSLYGLQPLAPTQTPLTYGPSPTPSPVPGDSPACLGLPEGVSCPVTAGAVAVKMAAGAAATPSPRPACSPAPLPGFLAARDPAPADVEAACSCLVSSSSSSTTPRARARAEDPVSSLVPTATTSAACTQITGDYPTMTIPAFCHPSQHVNAPRLASPPSGLALATTTLGGMMSGKVDCCASCAGVYNCVAWRFAPAYTQPPTPKLPGGFDPWGRGGCEIVYHTGSGDTAAAGKNNDTLAVCPNGRVPGLLDAADGVSATPKWANVYYNGWNEGACGQPADATTNSQDPGVGDKDALCPGQLDG